jgi:small multidrug resistance pump
VTFLYLGLAIAFEITGTSLMKFTEGFTRVSPTVACLAAYAAAFVALSRAIQAGLSVGTGYALWSGLGTTAIAVIGALFLHEAMTPVKIVGIALVVTGVVVLNLGGAH